MPFIRLYLVPRTPKAQQQVLDIDVEDLVLSNGAFVPVQLAKSVTMVGASVASQFTPFDSSAGSLSFMTSQQEEYRVCWREPVDADDYPNEAVITEADPSNGECVCGVTCRGTNISYVKVQVVAPVSTI